MNGPTFDEIQATFGAVISAAEAHGTLCGLLCVTAHDLPEVWIDNTLADSAEGESVPVEVDCAPLIELYAATAAALAGDEMAFAPLLPSDDATLAARADALGAWCQGFLYGLVARGLREVGELPAEPKEIVQDLAEIARAEADGVEDEEGEQAYAELVEFVRVGVQLVYEHFVPSDRRASMGEQ